MGIVDSTIGEEEQEISLITRRNLRRGCVNRRLDIIKYWTQFADKSDLSYALCYACEEGAFDIVEYLIKMGADIRVKNGYPKRVAEFKGYMRIVNYLDGIGIPQVIPEPENPLENTLKEIKDTETKDEGKKCTICMTNERIIAFQCGHKHTCASCSLELIRTKKPCPMCRVEIVNLFRVFD